VTAPDHERRNREFWDADADDYQAAHGAFLGEEPRAWGAFRIPDDDLHVLGDTHGLDVLEYGCGAAQWSRALAADGASVVALDQSHRQLRHARAALDADDLDGVRLVCGSGEATPFADEAFDLVFCDHGAMSFCEPERSVPEVVRILRSGGRLVFSHITPWPYLTWSRRRERFTRTLRRSYFRMHRFDLGNGQGTVDFQLPYGEWIRCFGRHGLVVEDLVELRPPEGATTTYDDFDVDWARRWPAEQIWVTRKR
jgi:SAM-dependent methyltransferase